MAFPMSLRGHQKVKGCQPMRMKAARTAWAQCMPGLRFRLMSEGRVCTASPLCGAKQDYFFLPTAVLAAAAAFFDASALLTLVCFCVDFFWFAFGDLSPMVLPLI